MTLIELCDAVSQADGVEPFNEATRIVLRTGGELALDERSVEGSSLAGVAVALPDAPAEVAIHPEFRRRGHGQALIAQAVANGARQFWAHGDLPAAQATARKVGGRAVRTLLVLRCDIAGRPEAGRLEAGRPVAGVTIREFVDTDADALIDLNRAAFVDHPEQGSMDRADFERRRSEPWFDPAGLFVAVRSGASGEELVGFHWTKIEDGVGEIYVLGVAPSAHGGGLGTALALRGIRHLYEQGICTVDLYVESDNHAAVGLYERLGFTERSRDTLYEIADVTADQAG